MPSDNSARKDEIAKLAAERIEAYILDDDDPERGHWGVGGIESIVKQALTDAQPAVNYDYLSAMRLRAVAHATRLRAWADNLERYGADITHWGSISFVTAEMRRMAKACDELGAGFYYQNAPRKVEEERTPSGEGWQPQSIETAPKDATPILGFEKNEKTPQVMRWAGMCWTSIPGGYTCHPMLWWPMPPIANAKDATPPASRGEGATP